jgi:hypothetical protein
MDVLKLLSPLQNFFSIHKYKILLQTLLKKKTNRTPRHRAKFPQESCMGESKCPLKSAILWRQNFDGEKIGVRILYLLFLCMKYTQFC